ncbi:MAG: heme exporter protein CcmD [Pseudomonadota bacterium]|nr:heme exporter protein CcmD [Pseudomonadota bacterium]
MSHDPHLGFVIAAYAFAFVIVAGMIVTILADYIRLKQALSSFSRETHQDSIQVLKPRDLNPQTPDPESFE